MRGNDVVRGLVPEGHTLNFELADMSVPLDPYQWAKGDMGWEKNQPSTFELTLRQGGQYVATFRFSPVKGLGRCRAQLKRWLRATL